MAQTQGETKPATIDVENVGGIDQTSVSLKPGVTILTGRNATNRTSFLQAIMAVMGSDRATVKADAEEGAVTLEMDGESYSRQLTAENGRVTLNGDPYMEDATLADLFAFLLESNECRQAVARGDDLREIIMRPVDTEEIQREIQELENKRDRIADRISQLDDLAKRLPKLEEEKSQLTTELEEKETELATKREELSDIEADVEKSRAENEALDEKLNELQEARTELNRVTREIESESESIDALEDELDEQQATFDDRTPPSSDRMENISDETQRMRGQVDALNQTINELQSVIQFNEEFLEDGRSTIASELSSEDDDSAIPDQLLEENGTVTCWTCGTEVDAEQIQSNLERIRSLHQDKVQRRRSLKDDIQSLQAEKNDLEERQQEHERLQRQIERTEREISDRRDALESLRTSKEELSSVVSELEADIEALQEEDHSEVLAVQEEVNHLEFEIQSIESNLDDVTDETESIESQIDERGELEARQEEMRDDIEELRTRVENLQSQAIDEFNEHMDAVLDLLDYTNLERIWIERTRDDVREGHRKVERQRFELNVVRTTDSGTVFEDTVEHLSESEREVTGLVFALAGYLVHEVYDAVPVILLDSIEALDSERITKLVEYFEGYAEYLVVALLEEDAAALDDRHQRVTSI